MEWKEQQAFCQRIDQAIGSATGCDYEKGVPGFALILFDNHWKATLTYLKNVNKEDALRAFRDGITEIKMSIKWEQEERKKQKREKREGTKSRVVMPRK